MNLVKRKESQGLRYLIDEVCEKDKVSDVQCEYANKKEKLKRDMDRIIRAGAFEVSEFDIGDTVTIKGNVAEPHLFLALVSGLHDYELVNDQMKEDVDEMFFIQREFVNYVPKLKRKELNKRYRTLEYSIITHLNNMMNKELARWQNTHNDKI